MRFQLASYDVVTAGPRFAITGQGAGVDSLADEQDGLVTLPFEVVHHRRAAFRRMDARDEPAARHVFISVPHGTSAGNMLRSGGLLDRILESDSVAARRAAVADGEGSAVRARVRAAARDVRRSAGASCRADSKRGCWRSCRRAI